MKQIEQRPYQHKIVERTVQAVADGHQNILIESATGSGKTLMALMVIQALHEKYGWTAGWTAMRKHLIHQASEENKNTLNLPYVQFFSTFNDHPPEGIDILVEDEGHHSASATSVELYKTLKPKLHLGLSVGGSSLVSVREDGKIRSIPISQFVCELTDISGEFYFPTRHIETRAFDGEQFVWKPIRAVLRHSLGSKKLFRIKTDLGRSLIITEDHAVFRAEVIDQERCVSVTSHYLPGRWNGKYRPVAMPKLVNGRDLKIGDCLILEDRVDPTSEDPVISTTNYIKGKWIIAGRFEARIRSIHGARHDFHKLIYWRRNAKFGWYLTSSEYRVEDGVGRIYRHGNGHWIASHIPIDAIAYLLGQYVGDGWRDGPRITFAVANGQVSSFLDNLFALDPYVEYTYSIVPSPSGGQSSEISINNGFLADIIESMCGRGAINKRIPEVIYNATRGTIEKFITGLMDSDGHLAKGKARYYYATISPILANGLIELLRFVGVAASLNVTKPSHGGIVNGRRIEGRHQRYTVHYSWWQSIGVNHGVYGRRQSVRLKTAGIPVRISSIEEIIEENVYDISVDDECQTFVANGFLVHNTATPFRTDRMKLCFSTVIKDAGIRALIDQGFLAPYHQYVYHGEWDPATVAMVYLSDRERWGKSVGFFLTEDECQRCADLIREGGVRCEVVTGSSNQEEQIEAFNHGDVQVLLNMVVLTEGFDSPILKTVFIRPGSKGPTIQMGGRVFRKHANKPTAQIVQSNRSKWPFVRIASSERKFICDAGGAWEERANNERVRQAQRATITAIAATNVSMPQYLKKYQKKQNMLFQTND